MTSTTIEGELRSKFWQVSNDVARMEAQGEALPLARASLQIISRELILRRLRNPRSGNPIGAGPRARPFSVKRGQLGCGSRLCRALLPRGWQKDGLPSSGPCRLRWPLW